MHKNYCIKTVTYISVLFYLNQNFHSMELRDETHLPTRISQGHDWLQRWMLSWAVTLEISARKDSNKPVKNL
jgi:hypothetical protein